MYVDPNTRIATYVNPLYGIAPAGYDLKQTDTGRLFYVNRRDGSMTWHKPLAIEQLPAGWEAGRTADGKMFAAIPPKLKVCRLTPFHRYYINHVTKSNTWVKPTEPAHVSKPPDGTARPFVPLTTRSAPTIPQFNQTALQNHRPQVSLENPTIPTVQSGNPPNPPTSFRPQPATVVQQATSPNPRPIYQNTQANVSLQSQIPIQTQPSHTTQATLPQFTTTPMQQGIGLNRPTATSAASTQSPQSRLPSSPVSTAPSSRPTIQNRIFSAPAATNAMNAASNMGTKIKDSMTALARNPNVQQAAINVGQTAIQTALSDDAGTSTGDSLDLSSIFASGSNPSNTAQSTNVASNSQPAIATTTTPTNSSNTLPNSQPITISSRPTQPIQYTTSQAPAAQYSARPPTTQLNNGPVAGSMYNPQVQNTPNAPAAFTVNQSSPESISDAPSLTTVQPPSYQYQTSGQPPVFQSPYQPVPSSAGNHNTSDPAQPGPINPQSFAPASGQPGTSAGSAPPTYTSTAASDSYYTPSTTAPTSSAYSQPPSQQYTPSSYQSTGTTIADNSATSSTPQTTGIPQQNVVPDNTYYPTNTQNYNDGIAQSLADAQVANTILAQDSASQQQQQYLLQQQELEQDALSNAILAQNAEAQQQQEQLQLQEQADQNALADYVLMQDSVAQEQQSLLFQEEAQQNALSYI